MIDAVVLAAAGDGGLIERWRDLGPVLWGVAGASVALWLAVLGAMAMWLDPRRVAPGAAVLDVVGDEPPAVVNLLTTGWELNHGAVPATLVDLAARRHVAIDQYGDDTVVRPLGGRADDRLTEYESMLLGHLRSLAAQTGDGRVPAAALSTGPEATSPVVALVPVGGRRRCAPAGAVPPTLVARGAGRAPDPGRARRPRVRPRVVVAARRSRLR